MQEKILVTRSSMPDFEEYVEAIRPLWDSHWLTNMGCYHREFESKLKDYLEVPQVSLVVNGHMALELSIQALDFPRGSEVITSPFTFISTTHAIVRNGLQPVFCDVKTEDGTIDEEKIEDLITEKTVAIVPVHVYGNPCNTKRIEEIAFKYGLKVIYDAAHAFGVTYKGRSIASYGDVSCFSFHATKAFNSVEGGAISFHQAELYDKLHNLKNFGIRGEELVVAVGANAKMNEFSAIMGLLNLKHFPKEIEKRKHVEECYREELEGVAGIRILLNSSDEVKRNYAYFPIVVDEKVFGKSRNEIYQKLKENDIFSRKYFYPLAADQACFKNKYKKVDLEKARALSNNVLVLPFFADLSDEDVGRICDIIKKINSWN